MSGNIHFEFNNKILTGGPIHLNDVQSTLGEISKITNIEIETLNKNLLGSVGKQEISGDIDIALDEKKVQFDDFFQYLNSHYSFVKKNTGLKHIHILVPIIGNYSKHIKGYTGYVQVDFFFGNVKWMKFSYFSAGDKSKYKGKYRTALLMSIVAARTEYEYIYNNNLVAKVGEIFDLNQGIMTQFRMAVERKDGKGYTKNLNKVSKNTFQKTYGVFNVKEIRILNPNKAAKFISEDSLEPVDLNTFEEVKDYVSQINKNEQQLIRKIFKIKTGYELEEVPKKNEDI